MKALFANFFVRITNEATLQKYLKVGTCQQFLQKYSIRGHDQSKYFWGITNWCEKI